MSIIEPIENQISKTRLPAMTLNPKGKQEYGGIFEPNLSIDHMDLVFILILDGNKIEPWSYKNQDRKSKRKPISYFQISSPSYTIFENPG